MTNHPFLKRIRLEREVIKTINIKIELFGAKLNGLSETTINNWCNSACEICHKNQHLIEQVKTNLVLIGKLLKADSGCSHRGAMIATLPSINLATSEIDNLKIILSKALASQRLA